MNKPPTQQQIEVQIMGQSYLLSCSSGGEAALMDAVERVDAAMCRIRDAGKVKARDRIAVLASLNLAFELSQLENQRKTDPQPLPSTLSTNALDSALNGTAETDASGRSRLDDLVRRLDQTLATDGQLL